MMIERVALPHFDNPAEIHHQCTLRRLSNKGKVMGDEEARHAQLLLQIKEDVHDLRPDGQVERTDGLIADQQLRLDRQGPRDGNALTLTARELPGIPGLGILLQSDQVQQLPGAPRPLRLVRNAENRQALPEGFTDRLAGIQRGIGILEDVLDRAPE